MGLLRNGNGWYFVYRMLENDYCEEKAHISISNEKKMDWSFGKMACLAISEYVRKLSFTDRTIHSILNRTVYNQKIIEILEMCKILQAEIDGFPLFFYRTELIVLSTRTTLNSARFCCYLILCSCILWIVGRCFYVSLFWNAGSCTDLSYNDLQLGCVGFSSGDIVCEFYFFAGAYCIKWLQRYLVMLLVCLGLKGCVHHGKVL